MTSKALPAPDVQINNAKKASLNFLCLVVSLKKMKGRKEEEEEEEEEGGEEQR